MRSTTSQSDAPYLERPKYIIPSLIAVFLILAWGGQILYNGWVEQHTVKADWDGNNLVFTVSDLDHRYMVTHLVDGRFGEIAAFDKPIVLYGSATMTRQQVEKLDWRSIHDGIYHSKNVTAGEKVAPPPPDFPLRAFYYQSETSGWAPQK